jgi:hypothetical protein
MKYKFLNIPSVPDHLILPVEEVLELENIFGGRSPNYTIHECQDELREYLQALFPECTKFRYQTLVHGVPVHKDRGRTTAINFILDTGGPNVQTIWYESDQTTPAGSVVLPAKQWHELQVDTHHTVMNIEGRRFAITVA